MKFVLVALAAVRLVGAAGDPPLNYFPPDTKVVIGIKLAAIRDSALFKANGADAQKLGEDWAKMMAFVGFDPLHDIDEILIFSSAADEKALGLMAVRGRFNLELMSVGAKRYHDVALLGEGKGGNGVVALLDATTALAGDATVVRAAIDRRGQGTAPDAVLAARVVALSGRFDIWGMGERPEGFVAPTGKRAEFDSIDRFEFGMRVSKGLEIGAEVHARTPRDAAKLAGTVEALKMMINRGGTGPKVDVQLTEGTVKLSLALSEDDLKQAMAMRAASAPKAASAPTIVTSPAENAGPATSTKYTTGMPDTNSGGTNVFVLPGRQ
jgi:hypothetical protein